MAEIYQIPESNGGTPQFTIPIGGFGGNGGFGFGNGMNGIADLFGLAIIASMFGWGSSIRDEEQMFLYIKDVLCDVDGYDGIVFCRFLADCSAKGRPIMWDRML